MQHGVDITAAWGDLPTPALADVKPQGAAVAAKRSAAVQSPRPRAPSPAAHAPAADAVNDLAREVCDLRRQLQAQSQTATIAMYAGIVVSVLLLIVIAQTQAKLHHAAEALLWTLHR